MKRMVLVILFVVLSNVCMADNFGEKIGKGFVEGDVPFHSELQKTAQEINITQSVIIYQTLINDAWENDRQTIDMYDNLEKKIEEISLSWKDNEWINTSKKNYSYDESGQLNEMRYKVWWDEEWIGSSKRNYIYDDKGYLAEELYQSFSGDEWTVSSKRRYIYDENMNMIHMYSDRLVDDIWVPSMEYIYTYDDQGLLIEELIGSFLTSGTLVFKINYTYDDRDLLIASNQSSWNNDLEEWKQYRNNTYSYNDKGNIIEMLEKVMMRDLWQVSREFIYSFDEQGRKSETLQYSYDYFRDGKLLSENRTLYSYDFLIHIAENSGDTPEQILLSANYPNPFNPTTTIEFTLPEAGYAELSIYNMTGQLVRVLETGEMSAGVHSAVWDGRDMSGEFVSSGVFFSRLKTMDNVVTNRMTLVK